MRSTRFSRYLLAYSVSTFAVIGLATAVTVSAQQSDVGRSMDSADIARPAAPEYVLVRFHADWCKACRGLESNFNALQKSHQSDSLLFITLDLTDEASRRQAEYLAASLRLSDTWVESGLRTGQMMLVSTRTGEATTTIASGIPLEEAERRINAHLSPEYR